MDQPNRYGGIARTEPKLPIRVAIAEHSYMIREFLTAALSSEPEVEVVAVCGNGKELQRAIATWKPRVVVTDIRIPGGTSPEVGVVVLSQYAEPAYAVAVLDHDGGGRAYLLKESIRNKHEFIGAIHAVACGESVIDPMIVDFLIKARSRAAHSRVLELTARERVLLADIASGKSNRAIAQSLVLTTRAVEKHVNLIFSKLGLPETQDVSRRVKATLVFLSEEGLTASH